MRRHRPDPGPSGHCHARPVPNRGGPDDHHRLLGRLFWSTAYAYNAENIQGVRPTTMADFFDLRTFPGRRGMRRIPQVNLEFALIADGVPLDQVYAVLDTPEGLNRAFRKLDTIKDQVIWWEAGAQPP